MRVLKACFISRLGFVECEISNLGLVAAGQLVVFAC